MSAEARANGWHGFDNIGERIEKGHFGHPPERGGWMYRCDGMPSMTGCGEVLITTRRLARVGKKSSGWVVCYGLTGSSDMPFDQMTELDLGVVLTFCPACVVRGNITTPPATREKA